MADAVSRRIDPLRVNKKAPVSRGGFGGYCRLLGIDKFVAVHFDLFGLFDREAGRIGGHGGNRDFHSAFTLDDGEFLGGSEFLGGGEVTGLGFDVGEVSDFREGEDRAFVGFEGVEDGEAIGVDFGFHS